VHCDTVKLTMSSPITGTGLPLNNVSPVLHLMTDSYVPS